jgi:hypothetical protein
MRRTVLSLALFGLVATCFTGCYISPVIPPTGAIYTNFSAPQTPSARGTLGSKKGQAAASSILGMFAWGDASVSAAAKDVGIKTINHTDYSFVNFLGVYQCYTTVVYGE